MEHLSKNAQNQRELRGKKVYIRPPKYEELEYIKWLWSDPETMKDVGGPITLSDDKADKWFHRMISPGSKNDYYCLIFNLNDMPVGEVSFHRYNPETRTGEFNIKIASEHRGKGYSKEAMFLLLKYFFFEFDGQVMIDPIAIDNKAGQQALIKFGFEHDPSVTDVFLVRMTKEKFRDMYDKDTDEDAPIG